MCETLPLVRNVANDLCSCGVSALLLSVAAVSDPPPAECESGVHCGTACVARRRRVPCFPRRARSRGRARTARWPVPPPSASLQECVSASQARTADPRARAQTLPPVCQGPAVPPITAPPRPAPPLGGVLLSWGGWGGSGGAAVKQTPPPLLAGREDIPLGLICARRDLRQAASWLLSTPLYTLTSCTSGRDPPAPPLASGLALQSGSSQHRTAQPQPNSTSP